MAAQAGEAADVPVSSTDGMVVCRRMRVAAIEMSPSASRTLAPRPAFDKPGRDQSGGPGGIGKRDRGPLPQVAEADFGAWAGGSSR